MAFSLFALVACSDDGAGQEEQEEQEEEESSGNFDEGTGLGEGECSDVCGTPGCGDCPSLTMVDGGGLMIAATEVSNAAYAPMLELEFDASILPTGCDFKSSFEPEGWTGASDELPVVGVDWCDAMVFCTWAGMELCGALDGGAGEWDRVDDAEQDAWYRACSGAGTNDFPYGAAYESLACNGEGSGQDALLVGGTLASCEGGVPGLFDMSGNVWEWSNVCESTPGDGTTECRRRGGSRHSDESNLRCGGKSARPRGDRDNAVGFRCCGS